MYTGPQGPMGNKGNQSQPGQGKSCDVVKDIASIATCIIDTEEG